MPELNDDRPAPGVHGVGDELPSLGPDRPCSSPGVSRVALRLGRDLGGFGDDQAGRGALGVIFDDSKTRPGTRPGPARFRVSGAMTMRLASFSAPSSRGLEQRARRDGVW